MDLSSSSSTASTSNPSTRFLHWNARGLSSNLPEFLPFISSHSPAASFICETFLMDKHRLSVPRHSVLRHDTVVPHSGGFACVVSDSFSPHLTAIPLPSSSVNPPFCTAFRVSFSLLQFTVISVYLRPQSSLDDVHSLEMLIRSLPPPYLIIGDFNAHHPDWGSPRACPRGLRIIDMVDSLSLVTLNNGSPTYFSSQHGSHSHIDLAFISPSIAALASWEVFPDPLGSDHFPCLVTFAAGPPVPTVEAPHRWITKKGNWPLFSLSFENHLATHPFSNSGSVDSLCGYFNDAIIAAATLSVPQRRPGPSKRPLVPWWNELCSSAVRTKRQAYQALRRSNTPANLMRFRRYCAIARRTVREAKRTSWRHFCSSISRYTPISDVWRRIHLINFNRPRGSSILPSLSLGEKALALMQQFSTPDTCPLPAFDAVSLKVRDFLDHPCPCTSVICLPFAPHELDRALVALKDSAPGADNIPAALLRNLPPSGKSLLLQIFNRSWQEGVVPTVWKFSNVIPIPKPHKPPDSPSSYRPISLTSVPCKTMERMILTRLQWFLDCSDMLTPFQNGFRRGRSTLHNHLLLETDIRSAFEIRHHVLACFLDLSKAFDTVWHDGLLFKLIRLGFPACLIRWLRSFLSGRSSRLRLGSFLSDCYPNPMGTPQGSVLSPTLFNLMVNDLPDVLPPRVRVSMFADDIVIWVTGKHLDRLGHQLQRALNRLSVWADEWHFSFCASKSTLIPFTRCTSARLDFALKLNDVPIPLATSTRFLGIIFDSRLSWTAHLEHLRSTCQKRINIMRFISGRSWGADRSSQLMLFKALVRPLLEYSSPLFLCSPPTTLKCMDIIQARCLRIATGLPSSTPHDTLSIETGVIPLSHRLRILSVRFLSRMLDTCPDSPLGRLYSIYSGSLDSSWRLRPPSIIIASRLLPSIVSSVQRSHLPLWMIPDPHVILPPPISKSHLSPAVLKATFYETLHSRFSHCCHFYTDGSFVSNSGFTSSSFWVPSTSTSFSQQLPDHSGIFTAELFAIFCALRYIVHNNITPVVIFSDSLSSLTAIAEGSTRTSQQALLEQVLLLLYSASSRGLLVALHWVPSHCGIEGNEKADQLAASPTSVTDFNFAPSLSDLHRSTLDTCLAQWQSDWCSSTHSRDFFDLKSTVDPWPHFNYGPRHLSSMLARLRTGHCFLRAPLFSRGIGNSPLCVHCQVPETVNHFLLNCSRFRHFRTLYLFPILDEVPGSVLTVKYLLRGGNPPFVHHVKIFSAVYNFILATGSNP